VKRKVALIIAVISLLALSLIVGFYIADQIPKVSLTPSPSPTPSPTYPYLKPMPTFVIVLSQMTVNVTQGEPFQINATISSFLNETVTFTPQIELAGYGNAAWDPSKDSHAVYNATFSPEQLTLEENVRESTVLTIHMASDAPLGRYLFYVGNNGLWVGLEVMVVPAPSHANVTAPTNPITQ
jgi:hypothetical protein